MRYSPGFGVDENSWNPQISAQTAATIHARREYENRLPQFYARYLAAALHGNLGESDEFHAPVTELTDPARPLVSTPFMLWGVAGGMLLGGWLAWLAVWPRRALFEFSAVSVSGLLLAVPPAVMALAFFFTGAPLSLAVALAILPRVFGTMRALWTDFYRSGALLAARARGACTVAAGMALCAAARLRATDRARWRCPGARFRCPHPDGSALRCSRHRVAHMESCRCPRPATALRPCSDHHASLVALVATMANGSKVAYLPETGWTETRMRSCGLPLHTDRHCASARCSVPRSLLTPTTGNFATLPAAPPGGRFLLGTDDIRPRPFFPPSLCHAHFDRAGTRGRSGIGSVGLADRTVRGRPQFRAPRRLRPYDGLPRAPVDFSVYHPAF